MSDDEQPRLATLSVTNEAWTDEIQLLIGLLEREFYVDAQMADGRLHIHRLTQVGSSNSDVADEDELPSPAEHRDIDELLEGMVEVVRDMKAGRTTTDTDEIRRQIRGLREEAVEAKDMSIAEREEYLDELLERLRESDRDIAAGRTSTLDEVREELDGDESDDTEEPEQSETSEESTEDDPEDDADESLTKREKRLQRLRENMEDGEPYTSTELAAIAFDKDEADVTSSAKAYVSGLRSELGIETMDDPRRDGNAKLYYRGDRPDVSVDGAEDDTEDDTDEDASDKVPCPHCGDEYAPKGLGPHRRSCPENPENVVGKSGASPASSSTGDPEQDSASSDDDSGDEESDYRYRCGGCGKRLPTRRGVQNHQNRSRDCTGADIERVEQSDDSETAASAADPSGDPDEEEDADLDPEVGAVPIDPDTVDEAVVDDDAAPDEPEDGEDKHRVRREPSTVREVVDAPAGRYLCLDCGFASVKASEAKNHDLKAHGGYTRNEGTDYRQIDHVPDDELQERWLVIYENVGSTWTHPKVHEARKNGIISVLKEADYFLDATQIRERMNELLQAASNGHHGRRLRHEQLVDDPGYLDELVEESRIERDGKTYGVDAERAAELVEATA